MTALVDQRTTTSLLLNVGIAVSLCLIINSIIFGFGFDGSDTDTNLWFAPPGWVVGTVWVVLFGLIGWSRYLLNEKGADAISTKRLLVGLLLFCLAYPIYTIGFNSELIGLFGNIATIALAAYAISRVWSLRKSAAVLLAPIVVWVSFATVIVLAELRVI